MYCIIIFYMYFNDVLVEGMMEAMLFRGRTEALIDLVYKNKNIILPPV